MTSHPLAGQFSVDASARRIRNYRYAEERLTRTMAGWIALTPELPAKLVLGRHVWDCAQHTDLWGKRLPELRAQAQRSEPGNHRVTEFMDLLETPDAPGATVERLAGVYRVLKPHLVAVYERHLSLANPVYEPPTRRILERCIEEERRHVAAGSAVLARLAVSLDVQGRADAWARRLAEALSAAGGVTGDEPDAAPVFAAGGDADPGPAGRSSETTAVADIVALDSAFDPGSVERDLLDAVEAASRAAIARDLTALERHVAPAARPAMLETHASAAGGTSRLVACAKIGEYRIVKLGLSGAAGASVVQLQCRRGDGGWQVVDARPLASEAAS